MSPYAYLDQSCRIEAASVRDFLERLLAAYPREAREVMVKRLKSETDEDHNAAFFELLVHELMVKRGFNLVSLEAPAPGRRTRPDFLFRDSGGQELYVEATLVTGSTSANRRAEVERERVIDTLRNVHHPRFVIGVREVCTTARTIGRRAIQDAAMAHLDQLAIQFPEVQGVKLPESIIEVDGLKIEIVAWERSINGYNHRSGVIYISYPLTGVRSGQAIRQKVMEKASKYGRELGRPLFIALNSTQLIQRDEDFEDAIFGSRQYVWDLRDEQGYVTRAQDGALQQGERVRYPRVSGLICFQKASPWRAATAKARVLENPHAQHVYDLRALGLPLARAADDQLIEFPGSTVRELLGLPLDWPTPPAGR